MRIVAGTHKGRNLLSPPKGAGTRPMTGGAKESLFQILAERVHDAVIADLYCGTGTLGLEALSRGAARVAFAERDPAVVARLERNIAALGAEDRCCVWRGDVMRRLAAWLDDLAADVDVSFVDPPYAAVRRWHWRRAEQRIFAPLAAHLPADGVVVLRLPDDVPAPQTLGGLVVERLKRYGDMRVALLGVGKEVR
ncbi:MAG: RsmD family RNA methyltransferase [Phycisphaerae bacterium]|nr:RsmD family RNA methyltransferase [Phycisphaerae bacterium]